MGFFVAGRIIFACGLAAVGFVVAIYEARKRILKANYEADKIKHEHREFKKAKEEKEQMDKSKPESTDMANRVPLYVVAAEK